MNQDYLKTFAKKLNGRDMRDCCFEPVTKEEQEEAKEKGIVICFGASDDLIEFRGAYFEEYGCWGGSLFHLDENGITEDEDAKNVIRASWCEDDIWLSDVRHIVPWTYRTNIPHETFLIFDDGDPYCVGLVFYLNPEAAGHPAIPKEDEILFAKVRPEARIPDKKEENAGYDIYACFEEEEMVIHPHSTKLVPTGIACALNPKWYFQVEERGSTGKLGMKKSAGVIDSSYRGEIFIAISNINDNPIVISKRPDVGYPYKKAIAQLVLHEVPKMKIKEISFEDLVKIPSERGTGKLGSSGK